MSLLKGFFGVGPKMPRVSILKGCLRNWLQGSFLSGFGVGLGFHFFRVSLLRTCSFGFLLIFLPSSFIELATHSMVQSVRATVSKSVGKQRSQPRATEPTRSHQKGDQKHTSMPFTSQNTSNNSGKMETQAG